jgi:hypothetical protein
MNCADLVTATDEMFAALDTNGDMNIDLGDDIGVDDLAELLARCDVNGNG